MGLQHISAILYGGEISNAMPIRIPEHLKKQVGIHTVRLVWLGLAYHANVKNIAYPTAATLASCLGLPERKVRCALQVLSSSENGYTIRRGTFKVGSHGTPYELVFPTEPAFEESHDEFGAGTVNGSEDDQTDAVATSLNTQQVTLAYEKDKEEGLSRRNSPTLKLSSEQLESFEEFWNQYPRSDRREDAFREWRWALTKVDPQRILEAMPPFLESIELTDEQFIPYASNWLRGERWDDEY